MLDLAASALPALTADIVSADPAAVLARYDAMVGAEARRAVRGAEPLSVLEWQDLGREIDAALPVAGHLAADLEAALDDCGARVAACYERSSALATALALEAEGFDVAN